MIVKLKRYVITTTRNIQGDVVERRYGYVIVFKQHWYNKPKYVRLIQDWYNDLNEDDKVCKIELKDHIYDATKFKEQTHNECMDIYNKTAAETIVVMIKEQPNKFILG